LVLDIIPQVLRATRMMLRRVGEVGARDPFRLGDARVPRAAAAPSRPRGQHTRPAGPERIDERQTGHRLPHLAQIDLSTSG
jgi:hypothetical protein